VESPHHHSDCGGRGVQLRKRGVHGGILKAEILLASESRRCTFLFTHCRTLRGLFAGQLYLPVLAPDVVASHGCPSNHWGVADAGLTDDSRLRLVCRCMSNANYKSFGVLKTPSTHMCAPRCAAVPPVGRVCPRHSWLRSVSRCVSCTPRHSSSRQQQG